jgi:ActR/RegA family two-component response regulator
MVATEQPEVRRSLESKFGEKPGFVIVGAAESSVKAMSLVRSLRPDVAVIDSALPHELPFDSSPLSRIGGLDTAQAISEEMPHTRVVLLTDADTWTTLHTTGGLDIETLLADEDEIDEVNEVETAEPAFTGSALESAARPRKGPADKSISIGLLLSFLGFIMIITVLMAPYGVALLAIGLLTVTIGLIARGFRSYEAPARPVAAAAGHRRR